jgi:putative endonuclease
MARPASLKRRKAERRGRRSETLAAAMLLLKGYRILGRRVKTRVGEIDLVARSPSGIVCFVEVKARADTSSAAEAVLLRQQARIARAAELFLAARPALAHARFRFDIVTVAPRAFPRHMRDAWQMDDLKR